MVGEEDRDGWTDRCIFRNRLVTCGPGSLDTQGELSVESLSLQGSLEVP